MEDVAGPRFIPLAVLSMTGLLHLASWARKRNGRGTALRAIDMDGAISAKFNLCNDLIERPARSAPDPTLFVVGVLALYEETTRGERVGRASSKEV